jgi:DNA-binding transcriptional MerR regulator
MVALELEVIALKQDRYGWERNRGTAAQDRLILDWIDALQDFPIEEVRAACRQAVIDNPSKTPNEGHVRAQIMAERARVVARNRRPSAVEPPQNWTREESEAYQARVALDNINPERKAAADAILKSAGFNLSMSAGDA